MEACTACSHKCIVEAKKESQGFLSFHASRRYNYLLSMAADLHFNKISVAKNFGWKKICNISVTSGIRLSRTKSLPWKWWAGAMQSVPALHRLKDAQLPQHSQYVYSKVGRSEPSKPAGHFFWSMYVHQNVWWASSCPSPGEGQSRHSASSVGHINAILITSITNRLLWH